MIIGQVFTYQKATSNIETGNATLNLHVYKP